VRLDNEFVVPRPVDEAWAVLTDIERIAPCMPGAKLTGVDGDDYHGTVKVKVGPVVAQYAGVARFRERDADRHHAVLEATGKQSGGAGRASAVVTADLTGDGDSTRVTVVTDLTVAGPLAQFGRGAIAQVSGRLLDQFVAQLKETVLAGAPSPSPNGTAPTGGPGGVVAGGGASSAGPAGTGGSASADQAAAPEAGAPAGVAPSGPAATVRPSADPAPADLLRAAAGPVLIRLIPAVLVVAALIALIVWLA
jgi:carbon monoxide dehydrogenase subunit G